jgi:hypothetical protein
VKKPNSLKAQKFKVFQYDGILYLYSRMHKESATLNSRLWGTTTNAHDYCDMLGQLEDAIHRNRPGCLLQRVIPLHNNTTTQHTSYKSSSSHFWTIPPIVGTAVAQWLRYCATNRKVAGSKKKIPDVVIGIFH